MIKSGSKVFGASVKQATPPIVVSADYAREVSKHASAVSRKLLRAIADGDTQILLRNLTGAELSSLGALGYSVDRIPTNSNFDLYVVKWG